MRTVDMVSICVKFEQDPLGMLEHGFAGLRSLSENGAEESRIPQTRALVASLITIGAFGEVAEALSRWLCERTGDAFDEELLVRAKALVGKKR